MMQNNANKQQLLNWIDMVSFALTDASLYLDTHPDDRDAIEYYNHFIKLRKEALEDYSSRYAPLTLDCVNDENSYWKWVKEKWPWEKGGCK